MPTYNKEETLAKAIESVVMQETDFDYKLIILDDCSTDNSNKIANEYKQKYPDKIEIVRNETNLRLLHSIMNGYKLLKGADYFCVLDADDWYTYNKKFADAVNFLDKHKDFSMYITNVTLKEDNKESLCYSGSEKFLEFSFKDRKCGKCIFMQTSGVIYRNLYFKTGHNEDFEKILGYKFPQSFRADGFRFEWYLQGGKAHFYNHSESVYNYDKNGIWSSMSKAEQYLNNAKSMYSYIEFFPKEKLFYYSLCKNYYESAIINMKNESSEIFSKNKDVIIFLYEYLYKMKDITIYKVMKCIIGLIPFRNLRKILRRII